jgi:(1->4)-alpha-D-glucan 1-alpha-D-glucosylmutase
MSAKASARPGSGPSATYRLQFNRELPFARAAELVDYLDELGVSHVYASPVFRARPGSIHGYDVIDHSEVNPELGGEEGLSALATALGARGMGLVLDLVPNHMCVASTLNRGWADVLENGPSSPFATFFDVDWAPPKEDLRDKVLLPILGDQFGRVLEEGEIRVEREGGAFVVRYYEHVLPLAPKSWPAILEPVRAGFELEMRDDHPDRVELESILTAISHLPSRSERDGALVQERQREKEVIKRRLGELLDRSPVVRQAVEAAVDGLNGRKGDPRSFDRLEALLADQGYRLSHWRAATDEINYRRFFDVNDLAAVRVEDEAVFEALHALPLRLWRERVVSGFRIDHVDGLWDPADYLRRLPQGPYVVVEKILLGDEQLRPDWETEGTTGYDFLNAVGGVFVDPGARPTLAEVYSRFTGTSGRFSDVVYESKKLVMEVALSSELTVLARRLDRISEQHRYSRDFTLNSQQEALAEVIASFPFYRSYVRADGQIDPEDRRSLRLALRLARRRNPAVDASLFAFIGSVLLLEHPEGLDEGPRAERLDFVMRFQQLTGPVMAKGLEDTASYRYHPLASLNEVGGDPDVRANALERFHATNAERQRRWPRSMIATSTHDTKRDEDARARISVVSEVAEQWGEALVRWREMNRGYEATVDEADAPDPNTEYLLYQTLVGTWPSGTRARNPGDDYLARVQAYMRKAAREAKVHTSWVSPNEAYEDALGGFVKAALDPRPDNPFLSDFLRFLGVVRRPGLLNAVSQVVLKTGSPGVPDFYQGTELPEYRLVDPDNRQPVDFDRRRCLLSELRQEAEADASGLAARLLDDVDERLKLWVTSRALALRRRQAALFEEGDYVPLSARGPREQEVVAFARRHDGRTVVVAVGRFFTRLTHPPAGEWAWGSTTLGLPEGQTASWRDAIVGHEVRTAKGPEPRISLSHAFRHLPVALLESVS